MLGELAVAFPEVRRAFEAIDAALRTLGRSVIGPNVFPPPGFDEGERTRQRSALADPEVPALAGGELREAGISLEHSMVAFKRPGTGISVQILPYLLGRKLRRRVPAGAMLELGMFE